MIKTKEQLKKQISRLEARIAELERSKPKADESFLSQAQDKYRILAENVADIIWTMDLNLHFTYFNRYVEKMLGYTVKEALDLELKEILPPDSLNKVVAVFQEEMAEEQKKEKDLTRSRILEIEHIRKNDSRVWAEVKVTFLRNKNNEAIGILGISRDITERKNVEERLREAKAELEIRVKVRTAELSRLNENLHKEIGHCKLVEEALKESEEKFRAIAENSLVGIGIIQGDVIVYANNSCVDTFGYSQEDLIGMNIFDLIAPEDRPIIAELAAKRLRGEETPLRYDFKALKKDGTKFDLEISSSVPLQIGGFPSLIVVTQDITERKRTQEELLEKERFMSSVFSSIQDGISVLDKNMNIVKVNPAMEKWYRHSMPLVGKKCYEAYHGRKERCKICPTYKTLQTGKAAYEVVPKVGEGGKIVGWLDLYSFPLIDSATGQLKGVIEYVRDISKLEEKKKKEQGRKR